MGSRKKIRIEVVWHPLFYDIFIPFRADGIGIQAFQNIIVSPDGSENLLFFWMRWGFSLFFFLFIKCIPASVVTVNLVGSTVQLFLALSAISYF